MTKETIKISMKSMSNDTTDNAVKRRRKAKPLYNLDKRLKMQSNLVSKNQTYATKATTIEKALRCSRFFVSSYKLGERGAHT